MKDEHIQEAYQQLVRQSQLRGETEERSKGPERRKHPRIKVDAVDLQVDTDDWIFVINLSVAGIAFNSDSTFEIGQTVTVSSAQGKSIKAKVIASDSEEEWDADSILGKNRVCCEFIDVEEGMAFLLGIKEDEEKLAEGAD